MKLFSFAVFVGCLVLSAGAYAQDSGQTAPPAQGKQDSDSSKASVTGCLTKGTGANEYQVTDDKSGEKVPFTGPAQLDKYVNQTVKLTGAMATQGSDKVFKPQAISQVSPSCEKSK
jgi:hypothetical protein